MVRRHLDVPWPRLDERVAEYERFLLLLRQNPENSVIRVYEAQLSVLKGPGRTPEAIRAADVLELTSILLIWGREAATRFDIGDDWTCIRPCVGPAARPLISGDDAEDELLYAPPFEQRTLFERAIYGTRPVPRVPSGGPLWDDPYGSAYNSPDDVRAIDAHLGSLQLDPAAPDRAREVWKQLREAYASAAAAGLGVSTDREAS